MDENFIDIINNHRALIYKVCRLYCDDSEDQKDLFQEIILQLWKSLDGFRQKSSLSTWMYRVALNTAITHFKKERRFGNRVPLAGIEIPEIASGDDSDELLSQLFKAIEDLDKIDKSIILLYLEEKTYDEISTITGLSKSNVGVRINRIKTKLSKQIN
jgi:RNA polymerase sigma-70 factor (ECF subfamily)